MFTREDRGTIAMLRLAHGKVNALDADLCEALTREFSTIAASDATGLVVTGTGSAFSAGVDLFALLDGGEAYARRFMPAMAAFFRTLITFPRPLVAAVNGHAIAGGCIIAGACDYRVMAEGLGRIGIPELIVGVPFPSIPLEIMAARLTPQVLRDLVFTGRVVDPQEAARLGLVDEVAEADRLVDRAVEHAERLARIPADAFQLTKRAFASRILQRVDAAAVDDAAVADAWRSPEVYAAIRAYLARTIKRPSEASSRGAG